MEVREESNIPSDCLIISIRRNNDSTSRRGILRNLGYITFSYKNADLTILKAIVCTIGSLKAEVCMDFFLDGERVYSRNGRIYRPVNEYDIKFIDIANKIGGKHTSIWKELSIELKRGTKKEIIDFLEMRLLGISINSLEEDATLL